MSGIRLLADPQADGWTQVAVIGNFKDARYGAFSITEDQVDRWKKNLTEGVVTGEARVAVDVEHAMDTPGSDPNARRAAGWITDLKREDKRVLAKIDWTPNARKSIEDGEFRYFSPTFRERYKLQDGSEVRDVLMGGAITNRPFLRKGMTPVTLSQLEVDAQAPEDAGASIVINPPMSTANGTSSTYSVTMSGTAADLNAALAPAPPEVHIDRTSMSDFTIKLGQALGLGADASEEQIVARVADAIKTPDVKALAQEQGLVILSQDQVDSLTERADSAVRELKETRFNTAFDKAVSEGRVGPAQKDDYKLLHDQNEELCTKMLSTAPKLVNTEPKGVTGTPGPEATKTDIDRFGDGGAHNVDGDMLRFTLAAEALVADGKADSLEQAGYMLSQTAEYEGVLS